MVFAAISYCGLAQNNTWSDMYGKDFKVPNGYISSISAGSMGEFIGGGFWSIHEFTSRELPMYNIAKWLDTSWTQVGSGAENGVNSSVIALCQTSQHLYVCGPFDTAGVVPARGIGRWNGSSWHSLGANLLPYRSILSINASDSIVYVGGIFDTIGGSAFISIAKYNGTTWSGLGAGLRKISTERSLSPFGQVYSIVTKDSNVYAGGIFDTAGTIPVKNIARWDGSSWHAMGAGINGRVNAMAVLPNGNVVVVSSRDSGTTVIENHIKIWNGSEWNELPAISPQNSFNAVALDSSRIYIGGDFSVDGSDTNRSLAMWDGNAWQSVGGGVWGTVSTLCFYNGSLYVGGMFSSVGSNSLQTWNIAKWQVRDQDTIGTGSNQSPTSQTITSRSFPNPSGNDEITIEFTLMKAGNTTIQMVTTEGQVIEKLASRYYEAGTHSVTWKVSKGASSQVYYCQIAQNGEIKANKIILQH